MSISVMNSQEIRRGSILSPMEEMHGQSIAIKHDEYQKMQDKVADLENQLYQLKFENTTLQNTVNGLMDKLVASRDSASHSFKKHRSLS